MSEPELKDDILAGANKIAEYTGFTRRTVYHAVATGRLPVFRVGESIYARKSTLMKWIAEQETANNAG